MIIHYVDPHACMLLHPFSSKVLVSVCHKRVDLNGSYTWYQCTGYQCTVVPVYWVRWPCTWVAGPVYRAAAATDEDKRWCVTCDDLPARKQHFTSFEALNTTSCIQDSGFRRHNVSHTGPPTLERPGNNACGPSHHPGSHCRSDGS